MATNAPRFNADLYREFRPLYPASVFRALEEVVGSTNPVFLDLGCGAGQSTRSFLNLRKANRGFAVDPDPAMLDTAHADLAKDFPNVRTLLGQAEAIPLPDAAVDLVLVGSAIHWFDLTRARPEIERVLRPGGHLYVFEYQFPKCVDSAELAEVVRRRFNLEWKAPRQTPRGTLSDLLAPFRNSRVWTPFAEARPEWTESLTVEGFLGHLVSQSRYRHAEDAAPDPVLYRQEVESFFRPYFVEGLRTFDLKPRAFGLKKTHRVD
jgi:ubiquinone/menaquinone biosynthesis C-methylase UbiE